MTTHDASALPSTRDLGVPFDTAQLEELENLVAECQADEATLRAYLAWLLRLRGLHRAVGHLRHLPKILERELAKFPKLNTLAHWKLFVDNSRELEPLEPPPQFAPPHHRNHLT